MFKSIDLKTKIIILLAVIVVVISIFAVFSMRQVSILSDPKIKNQIEVEKLITKISRLMVLPENEVPTVVSVVDPALLADQVFFKRAEAGDKVLIYTSTRQAILYSVSLNKILQVAPFDPDNVGKVIVDSKKNSD